MATKEKYPIGLQNFREVINGNYIYVDKTSYIQDLVDSGKYYFLGRPRRFGKSLLLSTMHYFFEGKRELFKGLAIDNWEEWTWEEYPVIHIDLNAKDYSYKESVYERLNEYLVRYEGIYGISTPASSLDERFRIIIESAYRQIGKPVVVLIDEYDKPILDTIHNDSIKEMHRDTLRAFYSTLKSYDGCLKFVFLTGVTKFGQIGVFSSLNNIDDISITDRYAGICGITEDELHTYFNEGIKKCAEEWSCSVEEAYLKLKENYDGYHFTPGLIDVYNPWSALNAINKRFIDQYWNQTGGGLTFLYRLLEKGKIQLEYLDNAEVELTDLRGTNDNINDAIPVFYQAGYLTIKRYDPTTRIFTLTYPNYEVESGFVKGLLPAYSGVNTNESRFTITGFITDLRNGDPDEFLERMQAFFEDFPYENALKSEKDFQNIMYCIAKMMGFQTHVEQHTARRRMDMIIETSDYVYIMEFKMNKSAEEALVQIESKGYAAPYAKDDRKLFCIGVEFSTEKRNIINWIIDS